jgi:hypothetical protein
MPSIRIQYRLTDTNDPYTRYLGQARDQALPANFWRLSGYAVGFVTDTYVGYIVAALGPYDVTVGRHFVVFGTSAETAYYHKLKVILTDYSQATKVETPPITVNKNTYGYVVYDVDSSGRPSIVSYGNINPGQIPPVAPPPTPNVTLTLRVTTGGTAKVTAGGTTTTYSPGTYTIQYPQGTYLTLRAVPAVNHYFDGWYSNGTKITSSRTTTLSLSANTTRRAQFTAQTAPPPGVYVLTLNIGTGGKLLVNNVEYRGTQNLQFATGTSVTLKIVPDSGYIVNRFTVDGTPVSGTTTTITMNTNRTVEAVFAEISIDPPPGGDWEKVIKEMMEKMVPKMMELMMIMVMMQMMVAMMQGLAAGI